MRRPLLLLLAAVLLLAACQAPAAAPTQAPAQKPAEQQPAAAQSTAAPAIPQQPPAQPAPATSAPLATAQPKAGPSQSGGVLSTPTSVPTPKNNPAGVEVKQDFWREDVSTNRPPARYDHAFAVEFEVYTMITFGGRAQGTLGDTWIYSQGEWFNQSPKTAPARFGTEAVYESGIYPPIFGGQSGNQFFSDVWKYKSPPNEWEQIATTGNGPAPRAGASLGVETNPLRGPYHNLLFPVVRIRTRKPGVRFLRRLLG